MQASQSKSKPTYTPRQKQLVYRCLPIGVTAILILCLEGWPPTAWVQFTRVCVRWSSLWSHPQATTVLPAFWLFLQSILLLAAWILWFRLACAEIMALVALSQLSKAQPGLPGQEQPYFRPMSEAQQPVANSQQWPAAPLYSPSPVTSTEQYQQQASPAQAMQSGTWTQQERQPLPPPPTSTHINQDYRDHSQEMGSLLTSSPTPLQSPQHNLKLANPFEEEEETQVPSFTPEARSEQASTTGEAEEEAPLPPPGTSIIENPFEEEEDTAKHQRIARSTRRKREPQPANEQEQAAVLQDLGFFQSEAGTEKSGSEDTTEQTAVKHDLAEIETIAPTRAQPSAVANPFDVQSDLIDLFQESSAIEEQGENPAIEEMSDPEQLYVFGNPFEGPLPDVFHHDKDLQRVVRELQSPEEQKGGQKKKEN
ncbi:hypothetical protein [Ktedonobacter sp. SOSP1-52]|uniref:hypothetical protein n=1 Tax=Ktedonobacter sp. SOSP1-52 TaxID=2778366 RepID=UPI001914F551|nr:hypothetical protein [Ktedonobacter sp. SOSP1-52]